MGGQYLCLEVVWRPLSCWQGLWGGPGAELFQQQACLLCARAAKGEQEEPGHRCESMTPIVG